MSESRSVRGRVSGRVQGVFFRASMQTEARRLGVGGWVRNTPDGDVEFAAHGTADAVDALLAWARRGPEAARVDHLEIEEAPMEAPADFEVRR